MKTYLLLFAASVCISSSVLGQTKLINHKSHSGSSSTFRKAIKSGVIGNSNFGQAPQRLVRNSKLDSVILLSPTRAVMITSESCHYEDYNGHDRGPVHLWSAGKDTVDNHELFNAEKSVSEIRKTLKDEYFFTNRPETVVFIGFDGNYPTSDKPSPKKERAVARIERERTQEPEEEEVFRPNTKKRTWLELLIWSLLSALFPVRF